MSETTKIKNLLIFIMVCLSMSSTVFFFPLPAVATPPYETNKINTLDDKMLGHLRHFIRLSEQPYAPNTLLKGIEDDPNASFYLTVLAHAIGLAHYHYTPAYPELYQQAINRVIQKMLGESIAEQKKGSSGTTSPNTGPKMLGAEENGPPPRESVMYSGHLFATAGLYTMLFNDMAYTKENALPMDYETTFPGADAKRKFAYNLPSLAEAIHDRYESSPMGFICDFNAIFLFCNGYTFYGFRYFDQVFGTQYLPKAADNFLKSWEEKGGFVKKQGHFAEAYLIAQDFFWIQPSAYFDAWAGTWMHAWNIQTIENLFIDHVAHWVKWLPDQTAYVKLRPETSWSLGASSDFGHFAVYTSELGDREITSAMLAYAEKRMHPVWENGAFYFPVNETVRNEEGLPVFVNRLGGDVLIGLARINIPNGIKMLFDRGVDKKHFEEPYIAQVAYPDILVRTAFFDRDQNRLTLLLTSGGIKRKSSFSVHQMSNEKKWEVIVNGQTVGHVDKGGVSSTGKNTDISLNIVEKNTLIISYVIEKDMTVIVQAVKKNLSQK